MIPTEFHFRFVTINKPQGQSSSVSGLNLENTCTWHLHVSTNPMLCLFLRLIIKQKNVVHHIDILNLFIEFLFSYLI